MNSSQVTAHSAFALAAEPVEATVEADVSRAPVDRLVRRRTSLLVAGLVVICFAPGIAPVSRTQEARVLETAREMLGAGADGWLVPRVNGNTRLRKPPLAYWATAASFNVLGVSEGAGRHPAALAGYLTVVLTAAGAGWLFGVRASFFAGTALLGSFLFFRHARLAETDVFAAAFVTGSVLAIWKGYNLSVERSPGGGPDTIRGPTPATWFHVAAMAMALAALSKGPPAAFPLLFLVAVCALERQWRPLKRFITCGAPLTAAGLAVPWFAYVASDPQAGQLGGDLLNSARGGEGHEATFLTYVPQILLASAPWSGILVAALVAAASARYRRDVRIRRVLIWVITILLPLCLWGNKQVHYLMTLMPPLLLLVGWFLDESLKQHSALGPLARRLWLATASVFLVAAPAPVVAGWADRGRIIALDWVASVVVGLFTLTTLEVYRRRGLAAGMMTFAACNVACLFVLVGLWAPSLKPVHSRAIAQTLLGRYGSGPYAFLGKEDLPLVFHMRRVIPVVRTQSEIRDLSEREPDSVFIEVTSGTRKLHPDLVEEMRFEADEELYRVGRLAMPPPGTPGQASDAQVPSTYPDEPDRADEVRPWRMPR